jgi:hypothetical protein
VGVCVGDGGKGRKAVADGGSVGVAVPVLVSVGVKVSVAVSRLGVTDGPTVIEGVSDCVGDVMAVMVAVCVALGFSGVIAHASQPMQ